MSFATGSVFANREHFALQAEVLIQSERLVRPRPYPAGTVEQFLARPHLDEVSQPAGRVQRDLLAQQVNRTLPSTSNPGLHACSAAAA